MSKGNIIELFINAAHKNPERTALIHNSKTITFAQLLNAVEQTATAYKNKGIQKGDRILVFVPMSIELYTTVLALFYIGACPVFLDEWVSLKRLKQCCETVPCKGIIAGRKILFISWFIGVLRNMPYRLSTGLKSNINEPASVTKVDSTDTALITFTTGSTGIPKAANRTHEYLYAQYNALQPLLSNDADLSFVSLPIVVLINLGLGKTTLLPAPGFSAKKTDTTGMVVDDMITWGADEIVCSPSVMLNVAQLGGDYEEFTEQVKYIFTGGGAVFPADAENITTAFHKASATVVYGSTEAEPISHIDAKELAQVSYHNVQENGLPVGMPDDAVQCKLIPVTNGNLDKQAVTSWQELTLPEGTVGEIVVAGNHVLKEYINNPGAMSANKIQVDGIIWHRTGDAGMLKDGKLYLYGRCNEIIDHNGRTYYPLISAYVFCVMTGSKYAALLKSVTQLIFVVEATQPIDRTVLQQALTALELQDAKVIYSVNIPKDKRHNTKVDYDALRQQLNL